MNENIPYELLARYFSGESPEAEKILIEKWRKESYDNEKAFGEYASIWDNSRVAGSDFTPKAADALEKINRKIELAEMQPSDKGKQRNIVFYAMRIAAVLLLSMAVWYGYNKIISKEVWITESNSGKEIKELTLSDGTKITLNINSQIKYLERFRKSSRNVELEGEAFFQIASNPQKPFIIKAQNSVTEVLGTAFNLKARPEEDEVVLTVTRGKVTFTTENEKSVKVMLEAGETGVMNKRANTIAEVKNEDINFMAWKTGILSFDNTPLKKVAKDLSIFYNVEFRVEDLVFDTVKIKIDFDRKSLDEVIEAMGYIGIQINKTDDRYLIRTKTIQ